MDFLSGISVTQGISLRTGRSYYLKLKTSLQQRNLSAECTDNIRVGEVFDRYTLDK